MTLKRLGQIISLYIRTPQIKLSHLHILGYLVRVVHLSGLANFFWQVHLGTSEVLQKALASEPKVFLGHFEFWKRFCLFVRPCSHHRQSEGYIFLNVFLAASSFEELLLPTLLSNGGEQENDEFERRAATNFGSRVQICNPAQHRPSSSEMIKRFSTYFILIHSTMMHTTFRFIWFLRRFTSRTIITSITRLGDFLKFLVTWFLSKVAQMQGFYQNVCAKKKGSTFHVKLLATFWATFGKIWATF